MSFSLTTIPLTALGALGSPALATPLGFRLGSVVLDSSTLEVPENLLLPGRQVIAQIDFPGGVRTHQTFGAFPETIEWRGYFTGALAMQRALQGDLMRPAGAEVSLAWGQKSYLGRVAMFEPHIKSAWLIPYSIRFMPRIDTSQSLPNQAPLSPEQQLAQQVSGLTSLSNGIPFPLPTALGSPVAGMLAITVLALSNANGVVDNISSSDAAAILVSSEALTLIATSLLSDPTPENSYMAQSATSAAIVMAQIVQHPIKSIYATVQVINPSLCALAAQYLGDANRWGDIAIFNDLPMDPFPIG